MAERYVVDLGEADRTLAPLVGGKAAHLGELSRLDGVRVPAGFCVTTDAFRLVVAGAPSLDDLIDQLSRVDPGDGEATRTLSARIRRAIEETPVPGEVAAAITEAVAGLGERAACAVRSSATAEDLPTASFAGQQDTYLNVVGAEAIARSMSRSVGETICRPPGKYTL